MSTGPRRELQAAIANAQEFGRVIAPDTITSPGRPSCWFHTWAFAGSIRRKRAFVSDVEHVVIPRLDVEGFPATNKIWKRLEELVTAGMIEKALYGTPDPEADEPEPDLFGAGADSKPAGQTYRWGPLYRGVIFKGVKHEIFTADRDNLGYILAIRTGPEEFSRHLVTVIKQGGLYHTKDGYVRYSTGASAGSVRPVRTEEEFFELCRVPYLPPEVRDDYRPKPTTARSYAR